MLWLLGLFMLAPEQSNSLQLVVELGKKQTQNFARLQIATRTAAPKIAQLCNDAAVVVNENQDKISVICDGNALVRCLLEYQNEDEQPSNLTFQSVAQKCLENALVPGVPKKMEPDATGSVKTAERQKKKPTVARSVVRQKCKTFYAISNRWDDMSASNACDVLLGDSASAKYVFIYDEFAGRYRWELPKTGVKCSCQ